MKKSDMAAFVGVLVVLALLAGGVILVLHEAKSNVAVSSTQTAGPVFPGEPADTSNLPTVYTSNFANRDTRGWSSVFTDTTPNGQWFLGQFNNEQTSLKVTQLPEHLMLRVSFDLYVINTWDGSGVISAAGGRAGPDYVLLGVEDGPTLMCATFSNLPDTGSFAEDGKLQTYPWPIPSRPAKSGTGASGVHSLGYVFTYNPPGVSFPQDSTYAMSFAFPHTADAVQFNFIGMGLQSMRDEGWGIANVKLELVNPKSPPTESQLASWWQQVLGEDAVASRSAFWEMVEARDATVQFLEKQNLGFGLDRQKTEALMAKLAIVDPDPEVVNTLADFGPTIEPMLREARAKAPTLKQTLDEVRGEIEVRPLESPASRKAAAASRLLEIIGSPEAARVQTLFAAKADPSTDPSTTAYAAEWKRRFDAVYRLNTGENIKYIPAPFIAERQQFLLDRYRYRNQKNGEMGQQSVDESSMVAEAAGLLRVDTDISQFSPQFTYNNVPMGKKGLTRQLIMLGLYRDRTMSPWRKTEVPVALEDIELPGDWIVRPQVSQQKRLDTLSEIIARQLNRQVRFVVQTESEDVVVVRGTYAYRAETPDQKDGRVHVYSDQKDPATPNERHQRTLLSSMIWNLNMSTGVRFIDETKSGKDRVDWVLHQSSYQRESGSSRLSDDKLQTLIGRLSQQTGLTFTREQRSTEKLVATEQKR